MGMKKQYEAPFLDIERFCFKDILTASDLTGNIVDDKAPDEIEDIWGA